MIKEFFNRLEKIWQVIFKTSKIAFWIYCAVIVLLASAVFLFLTLMSWPEDRTFEKQYLEGAAEAAPILTKYGLCSSIQRCSGYGIFFAGPLSEGMDVQIYGTTDVNLLGEFSQVFIKKFVETKKMKHLIITAYAFTTKGAGNKLSRRKRQEGPIFELDMRR